MRYLLHKILVLLGEGGKEVGDHHFAVRLALRDVIHALLNVGSDQRQHQLRIDTMVAVNQRDAQLGRHQPSAPKKQQQQRAMNKEQQTNASDNIG